MDNLFDTNIMFVIANVFPNHVCYVNLNSESSAMCNYISLETGNLYFDPDVYCILIARIIRANMLKDANPIGQCSPS